MSWNNGFWNSIVVTLSSNANNKVYTSTIFFMYPVHVCPIAISVIYCSNFIMKAITSRPLCDIFLPLNPLEGILS